MTKYLLNDRQKDLLRSLVPHLEAEDGIIESPLVLMRDRIQIMAIKGINDDDLNKYWLNTAKNTDFDDFVECGFFRVLDWDRHGMGYSFSLYAQLIIEAVKNDFDLQGDITTEQIIEIENLFDLRFIANNKAFGEPSQDAQFQCDVFTIMPFADEFKAIYKGHIVRAFAKSG